MKTLSCPGMTLTVAESDRCRANMANVRHSRPNSGIGFAIKALKIFEVVPFSLGSGERERETTDYEPLREGERDNRLRARPHLVASGNDLGAHRQQHLPMTNEIRKLRGGGCFL